MHILTANRHEIYLTLLAQTGHHFDVLESLGRESTTWNPQCGIPPDNLTLRKWDDRIITDLKAGHYDYVICHTVKDLITFWRYPKNSFIFIIHIALYSHGWLWKIKGFFKRLVLSIFMKTRDCKIVAVSEFKRDSWRLGSFPHRVIKLTCLNVEQARYDNPIPQLIVVGNHFSKRAELNKPLLDELLRHFPITIVGQNPDIDHESIVICKTREEYLKVLSEHDIYIFTTEYPWNDGYSTATLEAMASGLALVEMKHPISSPIIHNVGGLLCSSTDEMVAGLKKLILNYDTIKAMGIANQKTMAQEFSLADFVAGWDHVLGDSPSVANGSLDSKSQKALK